MRNGVLDYKIQIPLGDVNPGSYILRMVARPRAMPDVNVRREIPLSVTQR
jgi:hypothetical protein